jgi:hypothetical protein
MFSPSLQTSVRKVPGISIPRFASLSTTINTARHEVSAYWGVAILTEISKFSTVQHNLHSGYD